MLPNILLPSTEIDHRVMYHALAHRAPLGSMVRRSSTVRCRAATKSSTVVKTPDKFIPPWRDCYQHLKSKGLRTVAPEEAQQLLATGDWVLLDVRRPDQHEESHPEGATNVPMYRRIDMSQADFAKLMKVVAYSFNGVQPIDSNNTFTADVLAAAPGKKYILMCEAGGTMRASVNFPMGKPSRSLQAAYKLIDEAGLTADDVVHLERGVYGWYQAELPMIGDYTPDLGRTPMAAKDPALQNAAQSAAYETKDSDKPLEQPKKSGWFPW